MSARRCDHGFLWKALNSLSDLNKTFGIAIERLYLQKTCTTDVPEELKVVCVTHYEEFGRIATIEFVKKYLTDYQSVNDKALAGEFGKNVQFWFENCNLLNLQ